MIYIDAEKAKRLSCWNQLPEEYKEAIKTATDYGLRYVKLNPNLMDDNIQYALQELGFYIYRNKITDEYEVRW